MTQRYCVHVVIMTRLLEAGRVFWEVLLHACCVCSVMWASVAASTDRVVA